MKQIVAFDFDGTITNRDTLLEFIKFAKGKIDNWVKPFAESLGINQVLGTQLELSGTGHLTGRFATANCYGEEKVKRLLQLYPDRTQYRLVVYGDSRGDKELLAFSDESYYKQFNR